MNQQPLFGAWHAAYRAGRAGRWLDQQICELCQQTSRWGWRI